MAEDVIDDHGGRHASRQTTLRPPGPASAARRCLSRQATPQPPLPAPQGAIEEEAQKKYGACISVRTSAAAVTAAAATAAAAKSAKAAKAAAPEAAAAKACKAADAPTNTTAILATSASAKPWRQASGSRHHNDPTR
nr:PhF00032.1 [Neoporphyra haitanensis]